MKRLSTLALFVALAISTAHAMSDSQFHKVSEKWAHVFGFQDSGSMYAIQQVPLSYIKGMLGGSTALGVSVYDHNHNIYIIAILNDAGYADIAKERGLPPLTIKQIHDDQTDSLLHEFVHCWGMRDESGAMKLAAVILRHGKHEDLPAAWLNYNPPESPENSNEQGIPPEILQLLQPHLLPPGVTLQFAEPDKPEEPQPESPKPPEQESAPDATSHPI